MNGDVVSYQPMEILCIVCLFCCCFPVVVVVFCFVFFILEPPVVGLVPMKTNVRRGSH